MAQKIREDSPKKYNLSSDNLQKKTTNVALFCSILIFIRYQMDRTIFDLHLGLQARMYPCHYVEKYVEFVP